MLVLGACAGMPTSSPVQSVAEADDVAGSTARYSPAPPVPGATPQQVVSGFLDAMLAYPVTRAVAGEYLTPEADDAWRPSARTEIYSEPRIATPRAPGGDRTVTVERRVESALDVQGRREAVGEDRVTRLRLERIDGEWRIANPPEGVLVTQKFAADYIRPFAIYFLDPSGSTVVPSLVHLVVGDTLPTSLVLSLARGPSSASADVRTSVPEAGLVRPSVPVNADGVADVEFERGVEDADPTVQERISAQLVWTLRQLPDVQGVRLAGASAVPLPGGGAVQPVDAWDRYGPVEPRDGPWAVEDDRLVELRGGAVRTTSGPWEDDAEGADTIAISDGRAAALLGDSTVRITDESGEDPVDVRGDDVVDVSWASGWTLLVVDRPAGGSRVRAVTDGEVRALDSSAVDGLDPQALRVSPDDGRYAMVDAAGGLFVGATRRDDDGRIVGLGDPRRLAPELTGVRSPVWTDGTRLRVLADTDVGSQVHSVNIDGSDLAGGVRGGSALLPDVGARQLAVGNGDRPTLWVVDGEDRLWSLAPGRAWQLADAGEVTSLAPRG